MKYPSFDHIIERLNIGKLFTFPGGVHPDDKKQLSNKNVIQQPSLPDTITLPIRQHIGSEGVCSVAVGDYVLKGQALSTTTMPYAVPVHAPTSGHIVAIAPHVVAHPSGLTEMCISIKPDGKDTWADLSPLTDYHSQEKSALIKALCQAGISGMGGAGFPTHIKATNSKPIEFLILNGVECEPYITADDRLMREHAWQIRQGLDILTHIVNPKAIIVAIEDNKPEAIEALNIACQDKPDYRVVPVETKYPMGGEKQLIQALTGREVPRTGLPADIGIMMFNVGTCFAVADAILHGKPLIERIVTVTGEAVNTPTNFRALLGTSVKHLLNEAGYDATKQTSPKVIMGGPMMGFALADATIPVVKTTNCLLVPGKKELSDDTVERPCIRCSACADACPASLLPQQMFWHAKAKEYDKAEEYDLFDCIECGACAYVCPSEIPLVHYYRQAKSEIRLQRDEKNKAEKAKLRFEARNERLAQEKQEREEKHRKAKEARLAAKNRPEQAGGNASSSEAAETKDKVAAALARAKAKKAAMQATPQSPNAHNESPEKEDKKAQVAAAIARAKAKKLAKEATSETPEQPSEAQPVDQALEDKKARVAAAVARAKEKKARQKEQHSSSDSSANVKQEGMAPQSASQDKDKDKEDADATKKVSATKDADKQARIAAAVAKAKAKKNKSELTSGESTSNDSHSNDSLNNNEAPANGLTSKAMPSPNIVENVTDATNEKKRRIAAAVAKAKAKKAEADSENKN